MMAPARKCYELKLSLFKIWEGLLCWGHLSLNLREHEIPKPSDLTPQVLEMIFCYADALKIHRRWWGGRFPTKWGVSLRRADCFRAEINACLRNTNGVSPWSMHRRWYIRGSAENARLLWVRTLFQEAEIRVLGRCYLWTNVKKLRNECEGIRDWSWWESESRIRDSLLLERGADTIEGRRHFEGLLMECEYKLGVEYPVKYLVRYGRYLRKERKLEEARQCYKKSQSLAEQLGLI